MTWLYQTHFASNPGIVRRSVRVYPRTDVRQTDAGTVHALVGLARYDLIRSCTLMGHLDTQGLLSSQAHRDQALRHRG